MTTRPGWHAPPSCSRRTSTARLDAVLGRLVEQHVDHCAECRARLAPSPTARLLDAAWDGVRDPRREPPLPWAIRQAVRAGLPESTAILLAAAASLRAAWLSSAFIALAFARSRRALQRAARSRRSCWWRPLVPVLGVAAAYGSSARPARGARRLRALRPYAADPGPHARRARDRAARSTACSGWRCPGPRGSRPRGSGPRSRCSRCCSPPRASSGRASAPPSSRCGGAASVLFSTRGLPRDVAGRGHAAAGLPRPRRRRAVPSSSSAHVGPTDRSRAVNARADRSRQVLRPHPRPRRDRSRLRPRRDRAARAERRGQDDAAAHRGDVDRPRLRGRPAARPRPARLDHAELTADPPRARLPAAGAGLSRGT